MPRPVRSPVGLLVAALFLFAAAPTMADALKRVNVPPGDLTVALELLEKQSGLEIIYPPELLKGLRTGGVRGLLPPKEALKQLLKGTSLTVLDDKTGVLSIAQRPATPRLQKHATKRAARFPQRSQEPHTSPGLVGDNAVVLQQVVVTAQKRQQFLQDTPVPVTALNPDALTANGQTQLQDYFAQVPGLSLNDKGDGSTNIVLRGIATGDYGNPTVAVMVDDVPFGGSTALAGGQIYQPDLDPTILSQVEVLRGPQGTLYGASSLGGLINYVTKDPSTRGYTGQLQTDVDGIPGGGVGYGVSGSANVPLTDTLAVRVSGFSRNSPGYIDNVYSGRNDVNSVNAAGGDASLLWTPSNVLSIRLGALYQYKHSDADDEINTDFSDNPLFGDLKQSFLPGSGAYWNESELYTSKISLHFGWSDLTSITGYGINFYKEASDTSPLFDSPPYNLPSSELFNRFNTKRVTQEFRLSSPTGQHLEWLLGAYFTHERDPVVQEISGVDPSTAAILSNTYEATWVATYQEFAGFGDATYHFTDAFALQGGLRFSENRQTYQEADFGTLGEIAPGVPFTTAQDSTDHSVTFLVVPQLKITEDMMAYIRIASGYRPGGPNADATLFNLPGTFTADTTLNYELGLKGRGLQNTFSYDLSAFYIDWRKVQLFLTDPVSEFAYFTNGGDARSSGLEAEFGYVTHYGLHVSANASYNVAQLASSPPPGVIANNGSQLPYTPKFGGSVSAEQDFPINDKWTGYLGGTVAYVGTRYGDFPGTAGSLRTVFPDYTTLDLRMGARADLWTATLYIRNATNRRGVLSSISADGAFALPTSTYLTNFIEPRTIGLSVACSFK